MQVIFACEGGGELFYRSTPKLFTSDENNVHTNTIRPSVVRSRGHDENPWCRTTEGLYLAYQPVVSHYYYVGFGVVRSV